MQLIFCVEANNISKSDYIYIKDAIKKFYKIDPANTKLTPYYLGGRGNYSLPKTKAKLKNLINKYAAGSKTMTSKVICCFDCDDYDINSTDANFLEVAQDYCKEWDYEFVWFCKETESVFLGRRVPDNMKKKEAEAFTRKKKIEEITINQLLSNCYCDKRSNLCLVLDKYLARKSK